MAQGSSRWKAGGEKRITTARTTPKREGHVDMRPIRRGRMDFHGEKLLRPIRDPSSSSDIHGN